MAERCDGGCDGCGGGIACLRDELARAVDLLGKLVAEGKLVNRWQKDGLELRPAIAFLESIPHEF